MRVAIAHHLRLSGMAEPKIVFCVTQIYTLFAALKDIVPTDDLDEEKEDALELWRSHISAVIDLVNSNMSPNLSSPSIGSPESVNSVTNQNIEATSSEASNSDSSDPFKLGQIRDTPSPSTNSSKIPSKIKSIPKSKTKSMQFNLSPEPSPPVKQVKKPRKKRVKTPAKVGVSIETPSNTSPTPTKSSDPVTSSSPEIPASTPSPVPSPSVPAVSTPSVPAVSTPSPSTSSSTSSIPSTSSTSPPEATKRRGRKAKSDKAETGSIKTESSCCTQKTKELKKRAPRKPAAKLQQSSPASSESHSTPPNTAQSTSELAKSTVDPPQQVTALKTPSVRPSLKQPSVKLFLSPAGDQPSSLFPLSVISTTKSPLIPPKNKLSAAVRSSVSSASNGSNLTTVVCGGKLLLCLIEL